MKIGVFIATTKGKGGTYQYSLSFIQALKKTKLKDNFVLFSSNKVFKKEKREVKLFRIRRFLGGLYDNLLRADLSLRINRKLDFRKNGFDLMLYPVVHSSCFQQKIPYIVCIHDLQHRINPQFPEVSQKGEWKQREFLYKNSLEKAAAIIAESKTGKEYIEKFYNISPEKIAVLPYLSPPYLTKKINTAFLNRVRKKYYLPKQYIFYPAQFWPHKNHQLIIRALAILKKKGLIVNAVFAGNKMKKWREYDNVMKLARQLGVKNQIKHLGYVGDKEMIGFYKMANCLVMPTFFGPSNIPPLEAFCLGCPVITSDIKGVREQVENAAILVNPNDEKALAKAILRIYKEPKLGNRLKKAGYKKIKTWTIKDFAKRLEKIIKKTKKKI